MYRWTNFEINLYEYLRGLTWFCIFYLFLYFGKFAQKYVIVKSNIQNGVKLFIHERNLGINLYDKRRDKKIIELNQKDYHKSWKLQRKAIKNHTLHLSFIIFYFNDQNHQKIFFSIQFCFSIFCFIDFSCYNILLNTSLSTNINK